MTYLDAAYAILEVAGQPLHYEAITQRALAQKLIAPQGLTPEATMGSRLYNAISIHDLRIPPANRLEKLSGDRAGQWSIRINDQWRVCFRWEESDAYDVEITDYH